MRRVGDFQSVGVQFSIPRRLGCLTLLIEAASLQLNAVHYRNCISRLWNACASPCFTQRLIYLCRHAVIDANRSMSHFNLRRREAIQRPATLWPESQ